MGSTTSTALLLEVSGATLRTIREFPLESGAHAVTHMGQRMALSSSRGGVVIVSRAGEVIGRLPLRSVVTSISAGSAGLLTGTTQGIRRGRRTPSCCTRPTSRSMTSNIWTGKPLSRPGPDRVSWTLPSRPHWMWRCRPALMAAATCPLSHQMPRATSWQPSPATGRLFFSGSPATDTSWNRPSRKPPRRN